MKKDDEVRLLLQGRAKGLSQEAAAARSGMSVRTARNYENRGVLPSQLVKPRRHRTGSIHLPRTGRGWRRSSSATPHCNRRRSLVFFARGSLVVTSRSRSEPYSGIFGVGAFNMARSERSCSSRCTSPDR